MKMLQIGVANMLQQTYHTKVMCLTNTDVFFASKRSLDLISIDCPVADLRGTRDHDNYLSEDNNKNAFQ